MQTKTRLIVIATGLALSAACAGCTGSPASETTPVPTITGPSSSVSPTWRGSGPQAPVDPNAPTPETITWSSESRKAATEVAVKFMAAYARPGTSQPTWADALAPFSSLDLMESFPKVDTKYLTTKDAAATGKLTAEDSDPYNASVSVGTSEGPWLLGVHRQLDGSWRVATIQPPVKQGH